MRGEGEGSVPPRQERTLPPAAAARLPFTCHSHRDPEVTLTLGPSCPPSSSPLSQPTDNS